MYGIYNVNTVNVKIFEVKIFLCKTYKILNFIGKNFVLSMASDYRIYVNERDIQAILVLT